MSLTLYITLVFDKNFLDYCDWKQQKQCLLIKTTCAVVRMDSLLCVVCVFISQYSNTVDFISVCEAQIGSRKLGVRAHLPPLGAATGSKYCVGEAIPL